GDGLDPSCKTATSAAGRPLAVHSSACRLGDHDLDFADAATAAAAVLAGAHIVRVHSVSTVLPAVRIADAILATRRG
ncbi:MAG: hypothetical protein ACRD3O_13390, partial [Terriglobia bacterium]